MIRRMRVMLITFSFFFQAEDGIRDYKVTGVQTCALPICDERRQYRAPSADATPAFPARNAFRHAARIQKARADRHVGNALVIRCPQNQRRSEERRVGKECRSRWSPYH